MADYHLAEFISSVTTEVCQKDDKRVIELMETYDSDKDGFFSEEDFVGFYKKRCKEREDLGKKYNQKEYLNIQTFFL